MNYCAPRGIPHWHFLGGPNRWTAHDRAAALSWTLREAERCRSCGTRPAEWDPERGGSLRAYEPKIDRCQGCATIARGQADLDALQKDKRAPSGARVVLRRLLQRVVRPDAAGEG